MLSIIIPARDEERAIGGTVARLNGVLSMEHEIVVSDDCSDDRTSEVAQRAGAVVVRYCAEHRTPGGSRNRGARASTGEFIAFIDADVTMPDPDAFFRRALAHFERDAELAGVCGPQRARPDVETWADRISFGILNATLRMQNNVLQRGEASGKNMVVRRSAFEKINGFREDIATREDGDFFYRISTIGKTLYDTELLVYHGARRAHKVGWAHLWYIWISNSIYFALFNKTLADDWKPVR